MPCINAARRTESGKCKSLPPLWPEGLSWFAPCHDRAPHGLVVVCKRWYQTEIAKYLFYNSVFQDTELSCTDVVQIAADFNAKCGFPTGKGAVYN